MEYTVIGDAVNLASRVQSLTKDYGRDILISDETARQVGGEVRLKGICEVTIWGKSAPVDVYAIES